MKYIDMEDKKERHMINLGSQGKAVKPLEQEMYTERIEKRANRDKAYLLLKSEAISKEYNRLSKKTRVRLVADWLWDLVRAKGTSVVTSYKEISLALKVSEASAQLSVSKLNFWEGYPFTWIPVPKNPGHIQLNLNNEIDYEKWNLKKEKIIASNEQTKEKAEKIMAPKQKIRQRIKNG